VRTAAPRGADAEPAHGPNLPTLRDGKLMVHNLRRRSGEYDAIAVQRHQSGIPPTDAVRGNLWNHSQRVGVMTGRDEDNETIVPSGKVRCS
jgi:hypothetical protein